MIHESEIRGWKGSEVCYSLNLRSGDPVKLVALDYSVAEIITKLKKTLIQYYRNSINPYNVTTWKKLDVSKAPSVVWHCETLLLEGFIVAAFFNQSLKEKYKITCTLADQQILNAIGDDTRIHNKHMASTVLESNSFSMIYWEVSGKKNLASTGEVQKICVVEILPLEE